MSMKVSAAKSIPFGLIFGAALLASPAPASATGTARIQLYDGSVKTYSNVKIFIRDESMAITSSDGQGTVVLGKAACTKIGALVDAFLTTRRCCKTAKRPTFRCNLERSG